MSSGSEPLQLMPMEKWSEIQNVLKKDWPRCIAVYNALEIQKRWLNTGFDYEFRIYCPLGDAWNGVIALHKKEVFFEMFVDCPKDDTTALEDAMKRTKLINWNNTNTMFAAEHVTKCIKKISREIKADVTYENKLNLYILNEEMPLFDVSLPPGVTFEELKFENIELIDSVWPHRYPGSTKYFEVLIKNKFGYGLFKNEELLAWVFIKEMGALCHIFTINNHRRKGYGVIVVKLLCNILRKEKLDVFSYTIESNVNSCKMHEKIGFERNSVVRTCRLALKK